MTIAELIRQRRTELSLSQEKVAADAGVSQSALSRMELGAEKGGTQDPGIYTVIAVARVLGVLDEVLTLAMGGGVARPRATAPASVPDRLAALEDVLAGVQPGDLRRTMQDVREALELARQLRDEQSARRPRQSGS